MSSTGLNFWGARGEGITDQYIAKKLPRIFELAPQEGNISKLIFNGDYITGRYGDQVTVEYIYVDTVKTANLGGKLTIRETYDRELDARKFSTMRIIVGEEPSHSLNDADSFVNITLDEDNLDIINPGEVERGMAGRLNREGINNAVIVGDSDPTLYGTITETVLRNRPKAKILIDQDFTVPQRNLIGDDPILGTGDNSENAYTGAKNRERTWMTSLTENKRLKSKVKLRDLEISELECSQ